MAITTGLLPIDQPVIVPAISAPRSAFYKNRQQERLSQPMSISAVKQPTKAASTKRLGLISATGICHRYLAPQSSKMLIHRKSALFLRLSGLM